MSGEAPRPATNALFKVGDLVRVNELPATIIDGKPVYPSDQCPCGSRMAYRECCLKRSQACEDSGNGAEIL